MNRQPVVEEGGSVETVITWSPEELFQGNWADEVEKEENECLSVVPFSTKPKPANSYAKQNQRPKQKRKKKAKMVEYKLFVGGIIFADLEEHLFEMEEAIGEEVEPEIMFAACDTLKKLRIDCFVSMFEEFGKVSRIKPNWEKRFCHVAYTRQEDALEAYHVLARAEERKKRQREFKDALEAAGFPQFAAPNFNFYVRWPRGAGPPAMSEENREPTIPTPAADRIGYWALATSDVAQWGVLNTPPCNVGRSDSNGKTVAGPKPPVLATSTVNISSLAGAALSNLSMAA